MICDIIWQGSLYEFRCMIERLHALVELYERTRHIERPASGRTELEEIRDSMLRNPRGAKMPQYLRLITLLVTEHKGFPVINKRALLAADTGTFHFNSTMTVVAIGSHLLFKRRDPYKPLPPITMLNE